MHPSSNPVLRGLSGLVRVGPHPPGLANPGGVVNGDPLFIFLIFIEKSFFVLIFFISYWNFAKIMRLLIRNDFLCLSNKILVLL